MNLIHCNECGRLTEESNKICPYCGNPLQFSEHIKYHPSNKHKISLEYLNWFIVITVLNCIMSFIDILIENEEFTLINLFSNTVNIIQVVMFIGFTYKQCLYIKEMNFKFPYKHWSWLSWIIPIIHLYKPYQIICALWDETSIKHQNKIQLDKSFIQIWWILQIITLVIIYFIIFSILTTDNEYSYSFLNLTSTIINIIVYIMDIHIIKTFYNKMK